MWSYFKKYSLIKLFRKVCHRILGIEKYKENIDSLYYFLNTMHDISSLPQTSDKDLRLLQLCDAELLGIFSTICKKYGLCYWLYGGTLLGAVRHKGFIPWDDDTDISMPRDDFEKAMSIFPDILEKYGIEMRIEEEKCPMSRIGIGYRHYETGIWIDVFPVDFFISKRSASEITNEEMERKRGKILRCYESNKKRNDGKQKVQQYKNKVMNDDISGVNKIYYDNMEFRHHFPRHYDESEIFPLTTLSFEEHKMNVPAKYHEFLTKMYGNYMLFPKSGIEHHGNESSSLKYWAKNHGVDMNEVYYYLKSVKENVTITEI